MDKTFTLDSLILLAYNETEPTEEFFLALDTDEELLDEYIAILETKNQLDKLFCNPADDVVSHLVKYSQALEVLNVKPAVETAFVIKN